AGLYYQDDIRISSKLSINLGLRWDVQTAPTERYNRDVYTFDTTASYPLGNAQATGELQFANGSRRAPWNTKWRDFQPRSGVAWQATRRMVVRAGYGLTFFPVNSSTNTGGSTCGLCLPAGNGTVDQTGFSVQTPFVATLGGGVNGYIPGLPG